jgi:glycosyltransferase involved in cell wall biosynthesis
MLPNERVMPIKEGIHRPLWSVMIPTYNCAGTLRKTLESVLTQDPGPNIMQITVVDNCSTEDDPEAVVKELGHGRVDFHRNSENIGSTRNFNRCINLARGELIHILHGDDYVLDGFYHKLQYLFEEHPEIGAAFCRSMHVDDSGKSVYLYDLELSESGVLPTAWLEKIATRFSVPAPAMVVHRKVYEDLGGYDPCLPGADDWEMWVRIANRYAIGYEATCLAAFRESSKSLSETLSNNKIILQDHFNALQVMQSYLPQETKHKLFQQAKENSACYSLMLAKSAVYNRKWSRVIAFARHALWLSPTAQVSLQISQLIFYDSLRSVWYWFRDKRKVS